MHRSIYQFFVCSVLLLWGFSPLHAQAPPAKGTAAIVAQAQTEVKAGHFDQALALLQAQPPSAAPVDAQALQLAIADVQSSWAQSLLMNSPAQALPHYQAALTIDRSLRPAQAANDLRRAGIAYFFLSQHSKALDFYQQALSLFRQVGDRNDEARTLGNLGEAYDGLKQYSKAIDFYRQALPIFRQIGDRDGEAEALNDLGEAYDGLSQYSKAIDFFQQALPLSRQVGDRNDEARTLGNLGEAYDGLKQYSKAIDFYQQALSLYRQVGDINGEANALGDLMRGWQEQKQPRLAIFYGKQAVNARQSIRAGIQTLSTDIQKGYLEANAAAYRRLADLLIGQGRLPEAQQVLGLLKQNEYSQFLRGGRLLVRAGAEDTVSQQADPTPAEAQWQTRYLAISDRVTAIGAQWRALHDLNERTPAQEAQLTGLTQDLEAANQAFRVFLDQLTAAFSGQNAPSTVAFSTRETQTLHHTLRALGPGTVALYTLVAPDRYRVILYTADTQVAAETAISAAALAHAVAAFRAALEDPFTDPRPAGQALCRILLPETIRKNLEAVHAQTLMWSLDGVLRYVPVAALSPDGAHFLVEQYQSAIFTPASMPNLNAAVKPQWTGLGMGVSRAHDVTDAVTKKTTRFPALPGVPQELDGVIHDPQVQASAGGVLPGTVMLDTAFTQAAMTRALGHYPLVHIASHFDLSPGDDQHSYLLLGDGTPFTLAQIAAMQEPFDGVDLLTLSACNTASAGTGDGTEVDGFGMLAQQQGANAVLASLWEVSDDSTQRLMQAFYRAREAKPDTSKAAALRQAQLQLLHGSGAGAVSAPDRSAAGLESHTLPADAKPFPANAKAPFAHPFYWAPFILIGNWK